MTHSRKASWAPTGLRKVHPGLCDAATATRRRRGGGLGDEAAQPSQVQVLRFAVASAVGLGFGV